MCFRSKGFEPNKMHTLRGHKTSHCLMALGLLFSGFITATSSSYFWHITDFHFDPTYLTSQGSCNVNLTTPGQYGDYECDAPYELIHTSVKAMKDAGGSPKFILYTGDTSPHPKSYDGFSTKYIISLIQNATDLFNQYFPDTQFVVALGNHDYYPKNQFPGESNEMYNKTAQMWSPWFNYSSDISDTFNKGAYYTQVLDPALKLRVVVTNTNLYLKENKVTEGVPDPGGQYAWLREVLGAARRDGEKVHLVTHVPPGVMNTRGAPRWFRESDNEKFNVIVRDFGDVIVGSYSCHEHLDTFRMYYKDGKPVSVMLVAPSVTPWRARIGNNIRAVAHNPAVRKIIFNNTDGRLLDIEQYYLDLPAANSDPSKAAWKRLYSFRNLYNVDDVTASSVHKLVRRMTSYGSREFHKFYEMNTVKANHSSVSACDCKCKSLHICSIQRTDYAEFDRCNKDAAACRRPVNAGKSVTARLGVLLMAASLVFMYL